MKISNRVKQAFVLIAVTLGLFITGAKFNSNRAHYFVTVDRSFFRANYDFMRAHDFDVAGIDIRKNRVTLLVDESGRKLLSNLGPSAKLEVKRASSAAPDPQFKTSEQIEKLLVNVAAQYSNIASVVSVGKSLEGRNIVALKITGAKNIGEEAEKPVILFNGMHHAREVMSNEVPLDIAETLLSGYGKDAKITHWVDSNVIYVMPMLNVDGNNKVWTENTWWRKNTRGGYGVDINRNYPYRWANCGGSSGSQGADDYHGPSAASEPETMAMVNFVSAIHPVFDISFHSYSELVIYPYGCGEHTESKIVVEPIGQQIASLIVSDDGQSHYTAGTPPELLYPVDGGDIDWMYHEANVIPFVIELNSGEQGFQPGFQQWRDSTVARLRPAWQYLLERLDGPGVSGNTKTLSGATKVQVASANDNAPYNETHAVRADGSFFFVLNAGDYVVTVQSADAKKILEQKVHVDQSHVRLKL